VRAEPLDEVVKSRDFPELQQRGRIPGALECISILRQSSADACLERFALGIVQLQRARRTPEDTLCALPPRGEKRIEKLLDSSLGSQRVWTARFIDAT